MILLSALSILASVMLAILLLGCLKSNRKLREHNRILIQQAEDFYVEDFLQGRYVDYVIMKKDKSGYWTTAHARNNRKLWHASGYNKKQDCVAHIRKSFGGVEIREK